MDIPAELIREQIGVEAPLEDSLRVFDPLVGDLVTSFYVSDGSKQSRGFIAFPMGETGCDLSEDISHPARRRTNIISDFSSVDVTAEGNIFTEPSHYPVKTFETPIRQIISSPVSSDLGKGNHFSGSWLKRLVTQSRNRGGSPNILVDILFVTVFANFQAEKELKFRRDEGNWFNQQLKLRRPCGSRCPDTQFFGIRNTRQRPRACIQTYSNRQ